jgi:glycosyltransferase involved in cell wall biosynthesis
VANVGFRHPKTRLTVMSENAAEKSVTIRQGARIFYRAWSHNRPTGGQKQMYRHVDILNSAGYEAYIFHHEDGFRVSWFDNDTRVVGLTGFKSLYRSGDILVLSEDVGRALQSFRGPKVIFNQNIYYGYMVLGHASLEQYPYQDPKLLGIIAVSSHNRDNLAYVFPEAQVLRVQYGIDLDRFKPVALANKSPVIATIMKGASTPELQSLFHMLSARAQRNDNPLQGFEWVFIKNNTEAEVAALLERAVLFIFLSGLEGLPLLPLEAMAAGCIVATFDVGPLREFVPKDCRFRPGDLVSLARWIEAVAASRAFGYAPFEELVSQSRAVAGRFNLESERDSVVNVWRKLLS